MSTAAAGTAASIAGIEPIVGRYLNLSISGMPHRVYFEEAGQGIPLVCLHTAGADGRQFRALLNDADVTRHYRVIVFDMPWHGKSSPPIGWQHTEYLLTSESYIAQILAICAALQLDKPVAMGCSIGGRIALYLALKHPEKFRAIIGLQASAFVDPYYDLEFLHRADVHGGEVCAGAVSGLVSPLSPDAERWETLWHYMQGGPGIFKGDLHFYKLDGDIREAVGGINTAECPLYLLTGEYDYSCPPADTRAVVERVPGAKFTLMPGLGHFPMSENPVAFKQYLMPVLTQIAAA
jgi:pimeloyl-ACP methyl ester carboxylesterase